MEGAPKEYSPEEKAELQQSRVLSDANLINEGARYAVGSSGEPVLKVTENQMSSIKEQMLSSSPEAQKINKLFRKVSRIDKFKPLFDPSIDSVYHLGANPGAGYKGIRRLAGNTGSYLTGLHTFILLKNDYQKRPYIEVERATYDGGVSGMQPSKERSRERYYSFEDFYKDLRPEEKEKGEALGKELESYLKD